MDHYCSIDIETYSATNLLKSGAYRYAECLSTEIMTISWSLDGAPVESWAFWHSNSTALDTFCAILADANVELRAFNAQFERVLMNSAAGRALGLPHTEIKRWRCTAVTAALHALPRGLGDCAKVLGTVPKNDEGKKIMLKLSKPRPSGASAGRPWLYSDCPEDFETLLAYNIDDVLCEQAIDKLLPKIPKKTQVLYHLDQEINDRGITADLELARFVVGEWPVVKARLDAQCREITGGIGSTQVGQLTEWCGMDNLRADVIRDTLALGVIRHYETNEEGREEVVASEELLPTVREVLTLRQEASKTSVTKYETLLSAVCKDDRLRGMFLFHGAQTGRWTGKIVQLHNLPRNTAKEPQKLIDGLYKGDVALSGNIAQQLIRPTLVGRPRLLIGDFASIELRVALWLAEDKAALKMVQEGVDMYRDLASKIYNKPTEEISSVERFVGKQAVLGLGYGMGPNKFILYCAGQGEPIEPELAQYTVTLYREVYKRVYDTWWALEKAAIEALQNPGRKIPVCKGKVHYVKKGFFLYCVFPSGRPICYPYAMLAPRMAPWGKLIPSLVYKGVDQKTGRWVERDTFGGRMFENVCQGIAGDILGEALLRVDAAGYPIIGHVHDEIISEGEEEELHAFSDTMAVVPTWAEGCPIAVEADCVFRYKK